MKTIPKNLRRIACLWSLLISVGIAQAQYLGVQYTSTTACNNNGQLTFSVSGGTAPYIYSLSGGYASFNQITQSSPVFTGLAAGYYSLNITDANGLTGYDSAYIQPAFYAYTNMTPAVCPSTVGSESVTADSSYSYSYTYLWSNGATTQTINNVPVGSNYSCTVTQNSTGCTAVVQNYTTMSQTSSIAGSFTTTSANCTNGTATVTPSGGMAPYHYLWSNGQTTAQATGLSGLYYTLTISDAQGCSATTGVSISQVGAPNLQGSYTAENCNASDGTATVTALNGTAPFSYLWSTGNTTAHITGLPSGSYNVSVTDARGCFSYYYFYIQKTTPINATTSTVNTSCTVNNGKATVIATGGTPPYSYVWNSSPVQTTATATGLGLGSYYVSISDAQGCLQTAYASVADSGSLSLYLTSTNAVCGVSPGSAFSHASGGTSPYQYIWNTGALTQNITGISQSECLYCTVTDHAGCIVSSNTSVLSISPIMLSLSSNNASCIYTPDGSAAVIVNGGRAPYAYTWLNDLNTSIVSTSATASGLLPGYYTVYVTDANQCSQYGYVRVGYNSILPCAVSISGAVYNDYNANCVADGPDYGLQNVWMSCLPDAGYQLTDNNGNYSFTLPPGTYSVIQTPPLYHNVICPVSSPVVTLTAGQSNPSYNFYNKPDSIYDLTIATIPFGPPVAGFTQQVALLVGNLGNLIASPDVVYTHTSAVSFLGSNPIPSSYDPATGRIEWAGSNLTANGISMIVMDFGIPSTLATGYTLNNVDTVYPIAGDNDTFNNFESYVDHVVRAYDPNYIDVTPAGTGTAGYISGTRDTVLQYVVHFQNTGNHYATDVSLKIPVDSNLDLSSFHFLGASTSYYKISADKNRMLTIDMPYIYLPDSFQNRLGSQGFAAFTFKLVRGLAPMTQIREYADIYFDYNLPVRTDTTLNTISPPASIRSITAGQIGLYPNPAQDNVTLDLSALSESQVKVKVYDMMGRAAIDLPNVSLSGSKNVSISISTLSAGVYTVEVEGRTTYVEKLVKTDR